VSEAATVVKGWQPTLRWQSADASATTVGGQLTGTDDRPFLRSTDAFRLDNAYASVLRVIERTSVTSGTMFDTHWSNALTRLVPEALGQCVVAGLLPAEVTSRPWPISGRELLKNQIRAIFPDATIQFEQLIDPAEGWSRPALRVITGIDDIERAMQLEDEFYARVDKSRALQRALLDTTVLFR
jgi:hypothetical protein